MLKKCLPVFLPKGYLATASGFDLQIWDEQRQLHANFTADIGELRALAFSPDGKVLYTAGRSGKLISWDATGQVRNSFDTGGKVVSELTVSSDGRYVLGATLDSVAILWDQLGNRVSTFIPTPKDLLTSIAFSPNGKFVLTGSRNEHASLWHLNGELIAIFDGHDLGVNDAVFSADGQHILTASRDATCKLWDLEGNVLQTYVGEKGQLIAACFLPEGRIAAGDNQGQITIWGAEGEKLCNFQAHVRPLTTLSFDPENEQLISTARDGTVKIWEISPQWLISHIK